MDRRSEKIDLGSNEERTTYNEGLNEGRIYYQDLQKNLDRCQRVLDQDQPPYLRHLVYKKNQLANIEAFEKGLSDGWREAKVKQVK